ncbi:uncharacterized protein DEA37_0008897 [Paragonimus westermani]|uniref:Uncharacterized protein n=1 Tax=Paragonimus westermani TaxID=34504 RepID=A0A5J4NV49_9TREM|nr:uncharacterized protein DEA37_0008897 [Paragonimus westermani]
MVRQTEELWTHRFICSVMILAALTHSVIDFLATTDRRTAIHILILVNHLEKEQCSHLRTVT